MRGALRAWLLAALCAGAVPAQTLDRDFILGKIAEALRAQGIELKAGRFDYNIFRFSATLTGVSMRASAAPQLPPFLTAATVELNINLTELAQGSFLIEDAVVRNPRLHLVVTPAGADNLPRPPPKQAGASSTPVIIERLRVSGGEMRVEDKRRHLSVELPAWQASVQGDAATRVHRIAFDTVKDGRAVYEGRVLPVRQVAARLQLDAAKDLLLIERFGIRTDGAGIFAAGAVSNLSAPVLDLRLDAQAAVGPLAVFAGVPQEFGGDVKLHATATGPAAAAQVAAFLQGQALRGGAFEPFDLTASASYDANRPWLRVPSFAVNAAAGRITGEAALALTAAAGTSTARVRLDAVDCGKLARAFKLPVEIASRGAGTVDALWPALRFSEVHGRAALRLDATRARPARNVLPVTASLAARYDDGKLAVTVDSLDAMGVRASGTATLAGRERLGGRMRVDAADVAGVLAALDRFLGKPGGSAVEIAGPATLVADLGGTLAQPRADLAIESGALRAGEVRGVALEARGSYTQERLAIGRALVEWSGQSVSAEGSIGLQGTKPLALAVRVLDARIEQVLSALHVTGVPAEGVLAGEARVAGTLDAPRVTADMHARDLLAWGEPFGALSAQATLEDRTLRVAALRLEKPPNGQLEASGVYHLDSRQFEARVTSRGFELQHLRLPGAPAIRGPVQIDAAGGGSLDDPHATLAFRTEGLLAADEPTGPLTLTANVAAGKAELRLAAPRYDLAGNATLGMRAPYPAALELTSNALDLARLPLSPKLTGTLSAALRGAAPLDDWRSGHATLRIAKLETNINGQPLRTVDPLEVSYRNGALAFAPATVAAGDSRLRIEGTMPIEPAAGDGALHLNGSFDLAGLLAMLPQPAVRGGGKATLNAVVRGSLRALDPTGTLIIADASVEPGGGIPPLTGANAVVAMKAGSVSLEQASAAWAGSTLRASATVPFSLLPAGLPLAARAAGPARVSFDVEKLELAGLAGVPEQAGGTVALHVDAEAPALTLDAVRARAAFGELALHAGTFELRQGEPSVVVMNNGAVRVEHFVLTGPESRIEISGGAALGATPKIDLRAAGRLDTAIATAMAPTIRAQGPALFDIALSGTPAAPHLAGFVETDGVQAGIRSPEIVVEALNARLNLTGDRVEIARCDGILNGGKLHAGGGFGWSAGELRNVAVKLAASDVYLNAPSGLKTNSSADLTLQSRGRNVVLAGTVNVLEGSYTDPLTIEGSLMQYLRSGQQVEFTGERNPLLSRLRFQVDVRTDSPLVLDNNLARVGVDAAVRLLGSAYQPGLTGRVQLEDGGEIHLNERTYLVDHGVITFTNQQRIDPAFDILAKTQVSNYDISLQVTGTVGDSHTTLTSDPALGETDIIALLVTGRTLKDVRGSELNIAKEQAMSYVAGRLGQTLSSQAQRTLGLSTFRIEPGLIAAEANPTARLTVGQDITRRLNLVYSMDLVNSGDQIWIAEYDLTKRFVTRGIKQQDNSYRLEFRHDFQFGGAPGARTVTVRAAKRRVGTVAFTGNTYFTTAELRDRFKLKPGKPYDFFETRKALDRLEKLYAARDLLEARIRLHRDMQPQVINLNVEIRPGAKVQFAFEGWSVPNAVRREVRRIWQQGVFDRERAADAVKAVHAGLVHDGYYEATVAYAIKEPAPGVKHVVFDIQPNARYRRLQLVFEGARGIAPDALEDALREQDDMLTKLHTDPRAVSEFLAAFYREAGYLDAAVKDRQYRFDRAAGAATAIVAVREGRLFHVGAVRFEGNRAYSDAELRGGVTLAAGGPYTPRLRAKTYTELQDLYWKKGYNNVEITYSLSRGEGTVDLVYQIAEGRRRVVAGIRVEGADQTSAAFVRGQIPIRDKDVLTNDAMNQARGNLYGTGAYSLVEIDTRPAGPSALSSNERPVEVVAKVREIKPFALLYGGFYDTDRGPGGIVDFSNRNTLGNARVLGMRARYDSQFKEARLYFSQPLLRSFPLRTTGATYVQRELHDAFITDRVGFSAEQEARFRGHYVFTYGYRMERTHTTTRTPTPTSPSTSCSAWRRSPPRSRARRAIPCSMPRAARSLPTPSSGVPSCWGRSCASSSISASTSATSRSAARCRFPGPARAVRGWYSPPARDWGSRPAWAARK